MLNTAATEVATAAEQHPIVEAFHLGGWGMYPTLIAGLCLLWASVTYYRANGQKSLHTVFLLGVLTLVAGSLGFTTGVMATLKYAAGQENQAALIAAGIYESLHNLALALTLIVVSCIPTILGSRKANGQSDNVPSRIPVAS